MVENRFRLRYNIIILCVIVATRKMVKTVDGPLIQATSVHLKRPLHVNMFIDVALYDYIILIQYWHIRVTIIYDNLLL